MSKFKVCSYHFHPAYRNGDLEEDNELLFEQVFTSWKKAKEFCEEQARTKRGKVERCYKAYDYGDVTVFTGKSWTNENTGEENDESYSFCISKM